MRSIKIFLIVIFINITVFSQGIDNSKFNLTGGMGIDFSYMPMVVDYINNNYLYGSLGDFNSAVEFWIDGSYSINEKWDVDIEYTYNYFDYSEYTGIGMFYELEKKSHLFSVYGLYKIPFYQILIRLGIGPTFNYVNLKQKIYSFASGSATGFGLTGKAEIIIPFSQTTFINLSGLIRYALISSPNSDSFPFFDYVANKDVDLNYLSGIIRIGLTYKF